MGTDYNSKLQHHQHRWDHRTMDDVLGTSDGYLENRSRYRRQIKTTRIVTKIVIFPNLTMSTKFDWKRFKNGLENQTISER